MDLCSTLIADGQAPELIQPGERALDDPAVASQPLAGVFPLAGDPDADAATAQETAAAWDVIRLVGMQLDGTLASLTTGTRDRRKRIDQLLEDGAVMPVGPRQAADERGAGVVRNKVALRARLAAIRRVRAGRGAPCLAGTLALSGQARSHSIASARPSSSSNT